MSHFMKITVAALILAFATLSLGYTQPAPIPPKADPAAPIDDNRLGEMLEGLGLEITRGSYESGAAYFDAKLTTQDYTFPVRISLSSNKRVIWLSVNLREIPSDTPAERLRGLLEAINTKTGKMQFRLVGNELKANQPLDNAAVTPVRLRREVNELTTTLQDTFRIWDSTKWESAAKKP